MQAAISSGFSNAPEYLMHCPGERCEWDEVSPTVDAFLYPALLQNHFDARQEQADASLIEKIAHQSARLLHSVSAATVKTSRARSRSIARNQPITRQTACMTLVMGCRLGLKSTRLIKITVTSPGIRLPCPCSRSWSMVHLEGAQFNRLWRF